MPETENTHPEITPMFTPLYIPEAEGHGLHVELIGVPLPVLEQTDTTVRIGIRAAGRSMRRYAEVLFETDRDRSLRLRYVAESYRLPGTIEFDKTNGIFVAAI